MVSWISWCSWYPKKINVLNSDRLNSYSKISGSGNEFYEKITWLSGILFWYCKIEEPTKIF
jgi:hypothetical protein